MAEYTKNFKVDTGNILSNIPGGKVLKRLGISGGGVTYTQKDPFGSKNSSLGTRVKVDMNGNVTGAGLEFVKKF